MKFQITLFLTFVLINSISCILSELFRLKSINSNLSFSYSIGDEIVTEIRNIQNSYFLPNTLEALRVFLNNFQNDLTSIANGSLDAKIYGNIYRSDGYLLISKNLKNYLDALYSIRSSFSKLNCISEVPYLFFSRDILKLKLSILNGLFKLYIMGVPLDVLLPTSYPALKLLFKAFFYDFINIPNVIELIKLSKYMQDFQPTAMGLMGSMGTMSSMGIMGSMGTMGTMGSMGPVAQITPMVPMPVDPVPAQMFVVTN